MWAKQRREEVLLDVEDVSAGHQTVMRWNAEEQWVWSAQPVHEALVSMETFRAVQARIVEARRGSKPRRGPKTERPYLLRGRLTCGLCRRKLQGSWHHGEPYYRCVYGTEYARSAKLDHLKVVYSASATCSPTSTPGSVASSTRNTSRRRARHHRHR